MTINATQARLQTVNAQSILQGVRGNILTAINGLVQDRSSKGFVFAEYELKGDLYYHSEQLDNLYALAAKSKRPIKSSEVEEACSYSVVLAIEALRAPDQGFHVEASIKCSVNKFDTSVTLKVSW